ncbi:MAG: UDP-2,3-diacylglucosamine diphosphatase LpxI [Verrucomicrobiota bacterium]
MKQASSFLPKDFDPKTACVGIIAGQGRYPELLRDKIQHTGARCVIVGYQNETSEDFIASFDRRDCQVFKVGQVGKTVNALKKMGASHAMMAGSITPRKLFNGLHPDLMAVQILARLKEKNAESIFSAIGDEIEKREMTMLDGRSFLDDHLASPGLMTHQRSFKIDQETVAHGISIAKEVARLDIGQGVVVNGGTVLAVEAFEGTDEMLKRAGSFQTKAPIFIKTVKPEQDYRYDVPVFGLKTIDVLKAHNIHHVALESGKTLILDKTTVLQAATEAEIRIIGY